MVEGPGVEGSPVYRMVREIKMEGRGFPAVVRARRGHDSKGNSLGLVGKST